MSVLKRDFGPRDLQPLCDANQISGVVSVQASQSLQETERLIRFAETESLVRGVVGWVPLASSGVGGDLERLAMSPWLKGVRHVVQDEKDPRFLQGESFNAGIRRLKQFNLAYDLLIFPWQLPSTIEFVDAHPEQRLFWTTLLNQPLIHPTMMLSGRRTFASWRGATMSLDASSPAS